MSGNGKTPSASRSTKVLKLSGSASTGGKPNVNLVSARGEITSPQGSFPKPGPTAASPTPNSNNRNAHSKTTKAPDLTEHPLYPQVVSLHSDLRPFLNDDWETNNTYKLTRLKYYAIMFHFDPETSARPTQRKDILVGKFKKYLLPKLLPFQSAPPANNSMNTDDESGDDYDPLSRRTTIAMLVNTIEKIKPNVKVSTVALKDEVLVLYKHYVNPNIQLPTSEFTKQPRAVRSKFVPNLSIQMIRHALQFYHPELFLNIPVLKLPNYISLYRIFISEDPPKEGDEELVPGYHYWINKDFVAEASAKNVSA